MIIIVVFNSLENCAQKKQNENSENIQKNGAFSGCKLPYPSAKDKHWLAIGDKSFTDLEGSQHPIRNFFYYFLLFIVFTQLQKQARSKCVFRVVVYSII